MQALALPIPLSTAVATVMLPFVTAASLRSAQSLTRQPHGSREDAKPVFSWSAVTLMLLLIVYDTVMATLSLTHMLPPSQLNCGLEQRWHQLFSNKNANVVRAIQDRHQCCGFNSPRDRAWPFPDRSHTATACIETFGRRASCRGGWRQDEQVAAGLMLLVALVAFLLKVALPDLFYVHLQDISNRTTDSKCLNSDDHHYRISDKHSRLTLTEKFLLSVCSD